jgi:uncharacterized membrane protein YedE/YeeE
VNFVLGFISGVLTVIAVCILTDATHFFTIHPNLQTFLTAMAPTVVFVVGAIIFAKTLEERE